jgi:hypothetical protein
MKFKFLIATLVSLVLSVSCLVNVANAGLISVDDWHLTTDNNGGLRQLAQSQFSDIYLAVSKDTTFNSIDTYEIMAGYRQMTTAEAVTRFLGNGAFGTLPIFSYYNQAGWSGYTWEGKNRYQFIYSDTVTTGHYKHAGNYESHNNTGSFNINTTNFAGFVLIKDDSLLNPTDVPEPSTLAIFALGLMGLASRRFKKQS